MHASRLPAEFKQNLLRVVNAVVPVSRGLFYEVDADCEPRAHVVMGGDTRWIQRYDSYRALDPFHPRHFQSAGRDVFCDRDRPLAADHGLYVQHFMHRIGVSHKAEIFIRDGRRRIVAGVRLGRDATLGAFDGDALARLELLLPVLAPACLHSRPEPDAASYGLTPRENQVLECLLAGLPDKLIARRLQVSLPTAKLHARTLYRKLGVRGRTEAVALAYGPGR